VHITLTTARLGSMIVVRNSKVLYHENEKTSSINSISQNMVKCTTH